MILGSDSSTPILEVAKLLRLIAFSYLIANGDLHAKNVSLRTAHQTGRIELTPGYDLLTTLPYGDASMALQMDGRDANLKRHHFVAFGERFGVRAAATEHMLDELCTKLAPWTARVHEIGFDARATRHLDRTLRERLGQLA